MSSLKQRLKRLEQKMPDPNRPRVLSFPTDGMSAQEIEEEYAREQERDPMTLDEWMA
jgi:hypothetical protein